MAKLHLIKHPVLQHKLSKLRDKNTDSIGFRGIMNELGAILAYEATRDLSTKEIEIETPLQKTKAIIPKDYPIVVSIMRAGNGMLEGVLSTLPHASAGHIGIYRDKFINNTVEYYFKLPNEYKKHDIFLIDPMVATADTAIASLDRLKKYEVGKITILCVLISPLAKEKLSHFHPDVDIYSINLEDGLDDNGYLLPGIGDAGDRLYNTL